MSSPWASRPAMARPTSRSLVNGPYMSAVSRKVTPRSRARWMVAIDSWSSAGPYDWLMPMQPRPMAETRRPWLPSVRCSMVAPLVRPACRVAWPDPGRLEEGVPRRGSPGPEFRKLWAANAISNLGDGVAAVAGPLLAASLTRNPLLVAGLVFAQRLPWLLFSLLSGALVDRLDRRRLMAGVDLAGCLLLGLLGIAVLVDAATVALLYAVFFAPGTAETLFDNAAVSILPAGGP